MASEWVENIKKELFTPTDPVIDSTVVPIVPPPSAPVLPPVKKPIWDQYTQNLFLLALSLSIFLVAVYQDKTGVRVFDFEKWNVSEKLNNAWESIKSYFPERSEEHTSELQSH